MYSTSGSYSSGGFGIGDMPYIVLLLITFLIGMGAQLYVNRKLNKYKSVPNSLGMTGAQCAQQMLNYYNIGTVAIQPGGNGQDFFDPRTNSVTLSPEAYNGRSITALATACHEVGHACQFAFGYTPMKIRSAIVPVANFASNIWIFMLIIGFALNMMGLVWAAIILYAAVVLFQLVTLPVELNASKRAIVYMGQIGLPQDQRKGSFDVLRACAFTYLAAALISVLQLLWFLGQARRD